MTNWCLLQTSIMGYPEMGVASLMDISFLLIRRIPGINFLRINLAWANGGPHESRRDRGIIRPCRVPVLKVIILITKNIKIFCYFMIKDNNKYFLKNNKKGNIKILLFILLFYVETY